MASLVQLHASPKALRCLLLTAKQLCRPRYKLYKTLVRPFVSEYHRSLLKVEAFLEKRTKIKKLLRYDITKDRTPFLLMHKLDQIRQQKKIVGRFWK